MRQLLQYVTRLRTGNGEADERQVQRLERHRAIVRQMALEPAHVIVFRDAGAYEQEIALAELGQREVADQLAVILQHGRERHAAGRRNAAGQQPVEPGFRPPALHRILRKARRLHQADAFAHRPGLRADRVEIGRAAPGELILYAFGREPQRRLQTIGGAEDGAGFLELVIDRRGQQRASARQLLIRIADGEAAGIVFAHLGIGVAERREVAVARNIHGEDVETGIAMDHPVGERQPDAAALAEAGHDRAGRPEIRHAAHRADERVPIRREGEGAVDDLLDACLVESREVTETDFQLRRDALNVFCEQFVAEIPGRVERRPGAAGLFIGAHQHAVALLAEIDFPVEIDAVHQLLAARLVELDHLGHVLGDEIHVLHGQHRQLEPHHAADLARPEAAAVDHVLSDDLTLVGDDAPAAVLALHEVLYLGVQIDVGTVLLGRFRIGMGRAVGIEMTFHRIEHRTDELVGIEQRHQVMRFIRRQQMRVEPHVAALGEDRLHPVEAVLGRGEHHARGHVQADVLAGIILDLLVELHRIFLQLGNVGIAVDRVHAAGGMPGRAGGQFRAFDEHNIGPAEFGEVIQDGTADDAAPDDDDPCMALHEKLRLGGLKGTSCCRRSAAYFVPRRPHKPVVRNLMSLCRF